MKNIKLTILGVATLLFALTLNFRHALNDYGVMDNKLHMEVLAQSNNTSGNGTSGNGTSGSGTSGSGTSGSGTSGNGTSGGSVSVGGGTSGGDAYINAEAKYKIETSNGQSHSIGFSCKYSVNKRCELSIGYTWNF